MDLEARLAELSESGLRRRMRVVGGPQGPRVMLDGRPVLLLCSNNYLGLADHPRVRGAAAEAAIRLGTSAGASRLISGNMAVHGELERRLADFKGTEAALLFGSGYLANSGTVAALAGAGGVVFSDELNHASIIDGCRLARAETFVYRHADVEHLTWGLRKAGDRASLIATDGVFSMDGDLAPLAELHALARDHGARLLVDEAHGTGAIGPGGRGSVGAAGLSGEVDVVIGTLGKALGSYGAYVCGSAELVEFVINSARPFIFSTALPPPVVAAASAALDLLISRPKQIDRLAANAAALREGLLAEGFELGGSETQIVPVIVGEAADAMALCERALEHGVFAQAIRPPTVPEGTCRLRATAMATHRVAEMRKAARVIGGAARELGITSTRTSSASSTRTSSASPAGVRGRDANRGDAEASLGHAEGARGDSLDQAA
jgi:8-amino-7-oxononanoate synthase